ncbi:MAG: peptide chain release factor N(5)-glutamine methyltransferase [Phycisphaeraceae bacterium]|nr:MAG: peptide chain release factor N(5)-glutamine methyltransferase [Phycisphaeraceae bacterium]
MTLSRPTSDQPQTPAQNAWTTRSLLSWMSSAFAEKNLDSPRLLAEMLLAHTLGCDRMRLYMDADRPANEDERARLRAMVSRALRHEPVQYLISEAWFFSMPFFVDRRVLVPRPSTETIVETVIQTARAIDGPLRIADICTGSGCISVALAKHLRNTTIDATDISDDALTVAALNAERHAVTPAIRFHQGDLLEPLPDSPGYDFLVSNPPYIPDHEWDSVEPNVKDHEPERALRAGPDGLDLIRPLLDRAPDHLAAGGMLLIEIASCNSERVLDLAKSDARLAEPLILNDFEGLPRVLQARRA